MPTMAQAMREYVDSADGKVTADDIKRHITSEYPDKWKASTLQAHLYACVINNPKAYVHHPSASRFLYRNSDGTFEIYSETLHGPNEWAPTPGDDETTDVGELIETSVSSGARYRRPPGTPSRLLRKRANSCRPASDN